MNKQLKLSGKMANPYAGEVKSLLAALHGAGFHDFRLDDGDGTINPFGNDLGVLAEQILAVDCSDLYTRTPGQRVVWVSLVLGNSPGELCSDYTCNPELSTVIEKESAKWEGSR